MPLASIRLSRSLRQNRYQLATFSVVCVAVLPEFNKEHADFGILHTGRRNSELHSGEAAFENVKVSTWHPEFYRVVDVLLNSMGMALRDLIGGEEAAHRPLKLIDVANDDSAKAVQGDIDTHRKVWAAKTDKRANHVAPVGCGLGNTSSRASSDVSGLRIPSAR